MKKIFTLAVAALMSLAASATNYKEPLTVELNGIPMPWLTSTSKECLSAM